MYALSISLISRVMLKNNFMIYHFTFTKFIHYIINIFNGKWEKIITWKKSHESGQGLAGWRAWVIYVNFVCSAKEEKKDENSESFFGHWQNDFRLFLLLFLSFNVYLPITPTKKKPLLIVFSFRHRELLFECLSFFCLCDRFKMADVKLLLTLFCAADCILLGMFIIASIFYEQNIFIVMHIHWPELSIPAN